MLTDHAQTTVLSSITDHASASLYYLPVLQADIEKLIRASALPAPLDEACLYAMAAGGKRIRPLLVLAGFLALWQTDKCDESSEVAVVMMCRSALAVEFLHGYSLVHDDLPCMDDDELRRGRPTCHIVYGEDVALLAGDALQSLAFEALTSPALGVVDEIMAAKLLQVFAPAARRMVAGQMRDILGEKQHLNQKQLEQIHSDKTGALIEAALLMGGVCAKADQATMQKLLDVAVRLGLGFQVQDDVLDATADTQTLGKPSGSDEKHQKSTYVKLLGVDGAYAYAKRLFDEAYDDACAIGGKESLLAKLVLWIAKRNK